MNSKHWVKGAATELSWRASVALPRKTERLEWVRIWGAEPLPDDVLRDMAQRYRDRQDETREAS